MHPYLFFFISLYFGTMTITEMCRPAIASQKQAFLIILLVTYFVDSFNGYSERIRKIKKHEILTFAT